MKIILTKEDIEQLIKEAYTGVTKVEFGSSEDLEITLIVDSGFFSKSKLTSQEQQPTKTIIPKPKTLDEINEQAKAKRLMSQGGSSERNLIKF